MDKQNDVVAQVNIVSSDANKNLKGTSANVKELGNNVQNTSSKIEKMGKSIKSTLNSLEIVGWIKTIQKATNTMLSASKAQSEYIENLNLLEVAFGDTQDSAKELIETLRTEIGLDVSNITRQLGVYRQMSAAMGYASETADLLSQNLLKMQMDISSLFNLDFARAGTALESAMTGQVKTIRSLTGADITEATLQQDALRLGIDKSVESMTRSEKTILIYLSLERQLANANGDVAKTVNSVSNQTKIFKEQIATASRQLGAVFIPLLKGLLPILNGILMAFNEIVGMLLTFFGIDAQSYADEFGNGFVDIETGLEGITTASEAAKKSLRGFDKLNVIQTPTSSGVSGGIGSAIGGVDPKLLEALEEYNLQLDKMKNKATEIRDSIMEWLGFSKDVNGEWQWSAETLLKNIWTWWNKLNILAKIFIGYGIATVILKIFTNLSKVYSLIKNKLNGALKYFNTIWELSDGTISGALDTFFKLQTTAEKTTTTIIGISTAIGGIATAFSAFSKIADEGLTVSNTLELVVGTLATVIGSIMTISSLIGGFNPTVAIITGIVEVVGIAIGGLITLFGDAKDSTKELYDELNSDIWSHTNQLQAVKDLSTELNNYIDSSGKVKEADEERVSYILNELNKAYGTQYELIDGVIYRNGEVVKSYQEIETEIDKYMAKINAQYVLEKYIDAYNKALDDKELKQQAINKINEEYEKLVENIKSKEQEYIEKGIDMQSVLEQAELDHKKALDDIDKKYENSMALISKYNDINKALFDGTTDDINKAVESLLGSMVTLSEEDSKLIEDAFSNTNKIISEGVIEYAQSAYEESKRITDETIKGIEDALGKFEGSATIGVSADLTKFNSQVNSYLKANKNSLSSVGITTSTLTIPVTAKKDGGFLDEGEFFIAREDGPEFVGTINGHTAVANNDQIVESISIGVAKAMMATGGNKTTVNITAEGDSSGLLDFITFKQKQKNRQYGLG